MTTIFDRLVCGVCNGNKVKVNEITYKNDICPKCSGRGYFVTEEELKEQLGGKVKRILYG